MNGFQKFLCVVNEHEETNFSVFRIFFIIFLDVIDQKKWPKQKKLKVKNQFFHARQPCKGIFEIYSLLGCFLVTSFPELLMAAALPGAEIFS